jgi:hypothetical protein
MTDFRQASATNGIRHIAGVNQLRRACSFTGSCPKLDHKQLDRHDGLPARPAKRRAQARHWTTPQSTASVHLNQLSGAGTLLLRVRCLMGAWKSLRQSDIDCADS